MKYDFHVHDAIRVEYRVSTDGPSFPRGYATIERETRAAGGNGVVAACALARWGAQVLLSGNALGDDPHGQFLQRELEKVPNLTFEAQIEAGIETPYAILIRAGTHNIGTLLCASASRLALPKRAQDASVAGFFFGETASFGAQGAPAILSAPSQDYSALVATLQTVASCYASLLGDQVSADDKTAFVSCVVESYQKAFDGPHSIPSLEEIEAFLGNER
ncbi:MAG: carbohydrate kinase family protein [Armatimonadetes bacterium]|nr:carbohydrate kinase family protein [Armatimonadota bacterium]